MCFSIIESITNSANVSFIPIRFWLCRAVESWLRSSSQYGVADQLFVINRGLLQHIVHVLLESESAVEPSVVVGGVAGIARNNGSLATGPPREVAQSSFDLLGEMIRFNMEACRQLDILLPNEAKVRTQIWWCSWIFNDVFIKILIASSLGVEISGSCSRQSN